jgi:IS66 C-terminal element
VETCKLSGVDPQAYLAGALTKMVNGHLNSHIDDQAANSPLVARREINPLRRGPQSQNGVEIGYTRPT